MLSKLEVSQKDSVIEQPEYITVNEEHVLNRLMGDDVVFFTGAGFSKAWHKDYPSGMSLFSIKDFDEQKEKYNFFKVAEELAIDKPSSSPESKEYEKECADYFKAIKFHLDTFRRYPSLLPRNLDKTEIEALEEEIRNFVKQRFEETVGVSEFDPKDLTKSNPKMIKLFKSLHNDKTNISFVSTNYDYIIEKIFCEDNNLDFTRGVINKNVFDNKCWCTERIPLYKINGGFEIKKGNSGFFADYQKHEDTPQIILPSQDQLYDDKYFKAVFLKSVDKLREAKTLVFIGYSMPEEDHTIQFLLKNFMHGNNKDKLIYVINRNADSASKPASVLAKLFKDISQNEGLYILDGDINSLSDAI